MATDRTGEILVYLGTYSSDANGGIHVYRLNPATGELTGVSRTLVVHNPFFLALRRGHLYSANVVEAFEGTPGGTVASFAVHPTTGELTLLNQQASRGTVPCHLSLHSSGRHLLVANYGSGSVSVLPILADGRLGPASDTKQHEGSGADKERQEAPHVHSITLDPAERHAYAADLGIDRMMIYDLDPARGILSPGRQPFAQVQAGAGPRHFAFHPNGRKAYLINELDNTFTVFDYDATSGGLTAIQTISTLPAGYRETSYCADVQVHPSGRFLYGSNRGHDSVAIFAIDESTGRLSPVGHEPTRGQYPWNLAIDPTATFLLATNQRSDAVVVFRIEPETGRLSPTGHVATVPRPVCARMVRLGA